MKLNRYATNEEKIRFIKLQSKEWDNFYRKFGHLTDANGYRFKCVDQKFISRTKL